MGTIKGLGSLVSFWWEKVKAKVAQSCPTLWDPMDIHGILQARILE